MNRLFTSIVLIQLLAPLMAAQGDTPVWAELRERALVRGTRLRLGDIAAVDGLDASAVQRAAAIPLGAAPAPGQAAYLARETIAEIISRASPGSRIELRGADAVHIVPETITLDADSVTALARHALHAALGASAAQARLTATEAPASLVSPAGRWSTRFEVERPAGGMPSAGLMKFTVRAIVDGVASTGTLVSFDVRRRMRVLVADADLAEGRPVDTSHVRFEERELGRRGVEPMVDTSRLEGLLPAVRIPRGRILTESDFRQPPVIWRNADVTIVYRSGRLMVRGKGLALADGAIGEVIPVRTGKARRTVHAIVRDSRTVEMGMDTGDNNR